MANKEKSNPKKEGTIEFTKKVLSSGFEIIKSNWKKVYIEFLKLEIIGLAILILFGIIGFALWNVLDKTIAIIAIVLLLLIGYFICGLIQTVIYNIVNNATQKEKTNLWENMKKNLKPYIKYILFIIGVIVIIYGLLFLGIMAMMGGLTLPTDQSGVSIAIASISMMLFVLLAIVSMLLLVIFVVTMMFVPFELFIERKGLRESIRKSYNLVCNNLFETILVLIVISIVTGVLGAFVGLPLQIAINYGAREIVNSTMNLWVMVPLAVVALIMLLIFSPLIELIKLIPYLELWKRAKGRQG